MDGYFLCNFVNILLQGFYQSIVLLLAVTVTGVVGRSNGAPESACATITPNHGPSTATGPVPYNVNISSLASGYMPGQSYTSEFPHMYSS